MDYCEDCSLLDCPLPSDEEDVLSVAGSSILDSDGEEESDVHSFQPPLLPSSSQSPSPSPSPSLSPHSCPPSSCPLLPPASCSEQEPASVLVAPSTVASPPGGGESGPASQPEPEKQRKSRVIQLRGKRKFRYVPDELPEVPPPKLAVQKTRPLPPRPLRITSTVHELSSLPHLSPHSTFTICPPSGPSLLLEPKRLRICMPSEDLRLTIVTNRASQTSVIRPGNSLPPGSGKRGEGVGGGGGGWKHPSTVNALAPSPQVPPGPLIAATSSSQPPHTCNSGSLPLAKPGGTICLFNKSPPFFANGLPLSMYTKPPTSQPSPSPSPPSLPPPSTSSSSPEMSKDGLINPFLSQIPNHQELLNPFVSALSEHKHYRASSVSSHWNGRSLATPNQHLGNQQRTHQCREGLFSQLSCPSPPPRFSFSLSQLTN